MNVDFPILYEDEQVVAITKPAGVVVNRSHTHATDTVQDWMERRYPGNFQFSIFNSQNSEAETFKERSGIAHRLDKETSGVLLCAKTPESLQSLFLQFKNRQIHKTYVALVHGKMSPEVGAIDLPISRDSHFRLRFAVREGGRSSQTEYELIRYYPHFLTAVFESQKDRPQISTSIQGLSKNIRRATKNYQGFSLLKLTPKTGRTHQIRVHLSHLNHPIVSDQLYSGKKRQYLDSLWCPRHFLHAQEIQFSHPTSGKPITVSSELPDDLKKALQFVGE